MKRITNELLICDSEEAYVKRLAEILLLKKEVRVGVRTCSSLEYVERLLEIGNVKVLLISEDVSYEERKRVFAGRRIVLTKDHCADLGTEEMELKKYQSIDKITMTIIQALSEHAPCFSQYGDNKRKIIGVYSPVHRIGKTTFALKVGKELAEEENVLYLNLESFAGLGGYFKKEKGQDLSHLLYYIRQESDAIGVRVASMVRQMGNLDYILPMSVSTDLKAVSMEEWKLLFRRLAKECIYSSFIIDIGDFVGDVFAMLELCDWIFIPYTEDVYAKAKMQQWKYMLGVLKKQGLESNGIYVNMDKPVRQAVAEAIHELQRREGMNIC